MTSRDDSTHTGPSGLPRAGDEIAGYVVEGVLGAGGMGAVFRARHRASGAAAAIKLLRADGEDPARLVERFRREVAAMARVDGHAGIVRVRSAGTFGPRGVPFVVMDLVEGEPLDRVLARGRFPEPEALALVEKIARALHHCHQQGIVHRDLKPANVIVRARDGEPVVTDFGLAFDQDQARLTRTGALLGTVRYMAPEQAAGTVQAVDARTDVHALGVLLFEALTGSVPYDAPSEAGLLKRVLLDAPPDPRTRDEGISPDVSAVVLRCLAKDRLARYRTALELAEDLARARRGEPTEARPHAGLEGARRHLGRHRRGVVAALALALVCGAAALAVWQLVELRRSRAALEQERERLVAVERERARRALEAWEAVGLPVAAPEPAPLATATRALADLRDADRALARVAPASAGQAPLPRLDRWEKLLADPGLALASKVPPADDDARALEAAALLRLAEASPASGAKACLDSLLGKETTGRDATGDLGAARALLAALDGKPAALAALHGALGPRGGAIRRRWRLLFERVWERALALALEHGAAALAPLEAPLREADADDPALRARLVAVAVAAGERAFARIVGEGELQASHFAALRLVRRLVGLEDGAPCPRELAEPVRNLAHAFAARVQRTLEQSDTGAASPSASMDRVLKDLWAIATISTDCEPELLGSFMGWLVKAITGKTDEMHWIVPASGILLQFGVLYPWHPGPELRSMLLAEADELPVRQPWSVGARALASQAVIDALAWPTAPFTPAERSVRDHALERAHELVARALEAPADDVVTRRAGAVVCVALARAYETRVAPAPGREDVGEKPNADLATLDAELAELDRALALGHPSERSVRFNRARTRFVRATVTSDDPAAPVPAARALDFLRLADEDLAAVRASDAEVRALRDALISGDESRLDPALRRRALMLDMNGVTQAATSPTSRAEVLFEAARYDSYRFRRFADRQALDRAIAGELDGLELLPDLPGSRLDLAQLLEARGETSRALEQLDILQKRYAKLRDDDASREANTAANARKLAETLRAKGGR